MRNISVEEILPLLDTVDKILGNKYYCFNNVKSSEMVNEESLDWIGPLIKKNWLYPKIKSKNNFMWFFNYNQWKYGSK